MASKADKQATSRSAAASATTGAPSAHALHTADASADTSASNAQLSVLLVQTEALEEDEAIRSELKRLGFRVKHQALAYLSKDDATHFVYRVCDPASALHQHTALGSDSDSEASSRVSTSDTEPSPATSASSNTNSLAPTSTSSPRDKLATPRVELDSAAPAARAHDGESLQDAVCALARFAMLAFLAFVSATHSHAHSLALSGASARFDID